MGTIESKDRLIGDKEIIEGMLESSHDGILVLNRKRIIYKNERFVEMCNFPKELWEEQNVLNLLNHIKHQLIKPDESIAKLQRISKSSNKDIDYLNFKDGRVWEIVFYPLVIDGEVEGEVWNFRDISNFERLKADLKIKEQAIESSLNGEVFVNMEGKVVYANQQALDWWGYNSDEVLGRGGEQFWRDPENFREAVNKLIKEGSCFGEGVAKRKDGSTFEIEAFSNVIKDKEGKPIIISSSIIDISQRKEVERELKKSKELYQHFIKLLPNGVFLHRDCKCLYANQEALKLISCSSLDQVIGRELEEFFDIHTNYRRKFVERLKRLEQEDVSLEPVEYKIILKDGTVRDIEASSSSLIYGGERYFTTIVQDISERKENERLQRKVIEKQIKLEEAKEYDRLKTEFFSNISHDFKTPLNIILGTVELLMKTHLNQKQCIYYNKFVDYTNVMKQNCYRLLRLLNNLLDITKFDIGVVNLNLTNNNIVYLVEDIVMSVVPYAEAQGIELYFDTNTEERIIACDPNKIERVILNLLSNSFKSTDVGGKITVKVLEQEDSILISVKDTGIGIPEKKLKKLFDRFEQADSYLSNKAEGSGVGLALVKTIIEAHNGKISVASQYGEWTEFEIELPIRDISKEDVYYNSTYIKDSIIERVNIEFSDVYQSNIC
jgi:PAS domain S-box-containing protein